MLNKKFFTKLKKNIKSKSKAIILVTAFMVVAVPLTSQAFAQSNAEPEVIEEVAPASIENMEELISDEINDEFSSYSEEDNQIEAELTRTTVIEENAATAASIAEEAELENLPDEFEPIWPVPAYGADYITCWFSKTHNGLDIAGAYGTEIVAAEDGCVVSAEYHYSWGNNVLIEFDDTYTLRYAHLTKMIVSPGEYVVAGQVIGYMGNTGYSFGNHLHFEIYENDVRIDPYQFLKIYC